MEIILRLSRDGKTGTAYAQLVNSYIKNINQRDAELLAFKGRKNNRIYSQKGTQNTNAF
ncbi:hypothetical protein AB7W88_15630 [Providencia vermicola]|uniref:hypothetical protein n=1 Tax=Providencia TaxID=586 RepID=UPI0018A79BF1|nr:MULTISPECIES: hypothetical protein [Providencia]ELR5120327.1 hypothetical protein [Providencia stuartii]ELR5143378.1 hypothetical protein [Providencia stuartii]MBG5917951.1 hypothetical protein [Providencia stuartii]WBA55734.1 hypothetical protein O7C57_12815 [Providencia sp. 21OH12SH02B-Prov]WER20858.1 hypothetical protein P2E04_12130 [Providencia stuartii]